MSAPIRAVVVTATEDARGGLLMLRLALEDVQALMREGAFGASVEIVYPAPPKTVADTPEMP